MGHIHDDLSHTHHQRNSGWRLVNPLSIENGPLALFWKNYLQYPARSICPTLIFVVSMMSLRIQAPNDWYVPVPISPAIPRWDRMEVREQYCHLMLMFFKPWRQASDLWIPGKSWLDAFESFVNIYATKFITMMDNMQMLHKCWGSRDDHLIGWCAQGRNHSNQIS